MKKASRFTVIILTASLLLSSCASTPSDGSDQTGSDQTTDSPVETSLFETLPVHDYGGETFTFLLPSQHTYEFCEEDTGDIVDSAAFLRDSTIQSTYNVTFRYVTESGNWDGRDVFNGLITNSVMADDKAYDLVDGMIAVTLPLAAQGVFLNVAELDGIDLTAPWWTADIFNTLGIADKLFGVTGSSLLSLYKSSYAMFANTKLLEEYHCDDLIDLVLNGKWTWDAFHKIVENRAQDLDHNDTYDTADFYGYIAHETPQRAFQTAFELPVLSHEDGKLTFTGLTERFAGAVEKSIGFFSDKAQCLIASSAPDDVFIGNRAMLYTATIGKIETFRDMESDFVIVPFPKLDEDQEKYHTQIATGSGMLFIPKTVKNVGMTVDIMNAHGCLSYLNVVPAYYESALKVKYTRDERNMAVIDIINASMSNTVEFAFGSSLDFVNCLYIDMSRGNKEVASTFASMAASLQTKLDQLYEDYNSVE